MNSVRVRSWFVKDKNVWCSVDLGESLTMHGISVELRADDDFCQHVFGADIRWLDVPAVYQAAKAEIPDRRSYEMVLSATAEGINRSLPELRRASQAGVRPSDGNLFQPLAWEGKSLAIPVDFIRMYGLYSQDGPQGLPVVRCNVQLGGHLCLFHQVVDLPAQSLRSGNPSLGDTIRDPTIQSVIGEILRTDCGNEVRLLLQHSDFSSKEFFRGEVPRQLQLPVPVELR
ncbi:hypothetical protein HYZ64_03810 [Candidatus Berkelbacteria bacterium]|nr:hypothetical protein [Candidatus Berkelbacteria bacterium]